MSSQQRETGPKARFPQSTRDQGLSRRTGSFREWLGCKTALPFYLKIKIPSDILIISIFVSTLQFWQLSLGSWGKHIFLYHFYSSFIYQT